MGGPTGGWGRCDDTVVWAWCIIGVSRDVAPSHHSPHRLDPPTTATMLWLMTKREIRNGTLSSSTRERDRTAAMSRCRSEERRQKGRSSFIPGPHPPTALLSLYNGSHLARPRTKIPHVHFPGPRWYKTSTLDCKCRHIVQWQDGETTVQTQPIHWLAGPHSGQAEDPPMKVVRHKHRKLSRKKRWELHQRTWPAFPGTKWAKAWNYISWTLRGSK